MKIKELPRLVFSRYDEKVGWRSVGIVSLNEFGDKMITERPEDLPEEIYSHMKQIIGTEEDSNAVVEIKDKQDVLYRCEYEPMSLKY